MAAVQDRFHSANGKRMILIVDDEADNRALLGEILGDEYDVFYASDGPEALDMLEKRAQFVSLVLLDLVMSSMHGLEMLKSIRQDPRYARIPVIVMADDPGREVECLSNGAIDFIPKPYPLAAVILARVRRTIELSEDRDIIRFTERDSLTGLFNREFFYRYARQYDQFHADTVMDCIVIDINHFHMLNERYGRPYGDEVLKSLAEKLRGAVFEAGGLAGRAETDCFLCYFPHGLDYEALMEKLSADPSGENTPGSRLRLRMGVYSEADKSIDIERRFNRAQIAADTVLHNYSRTIAYYDDALHETALHDEQLIEDFQAALSGGQFKVYYQPKFDIRGAEPVLSSAEALVRWEHPRLGLISPGSFISLFENNGMIEQLDRFVWNEVAAQIRDWKTRFGFSVPVSVNVSRVDMYDLELTATFLDILKEYDLEPGEFLLEITESAYTEDQNQLIETVHQLRTFGFRIEMDDFGTGYSSLGMISHLPIDALKLDMFFVRNAFTEHRDVRMLELIIEIADCLGVPVIAEGVEIEDQLIALKAMGCDIVQGFYFSEPVPPEQFDSFIEEKRRQSPPVPAKDEQDEDGGPQPGVYPLSNMSKALSSDFDRVFYVDTVSGYFMAFGPSESDEVLNMRRGGEDFFEAVQTHLLSYVIDEDKERVSETLKRDYLLERIRLDKMLTLTYRMEVDGKAAYYALKAVPARNGDGKHLVVSIEVVDKKMRQAIDAEQKVVGSAALQGLIRTLAGSYDVVFFIDIESEAYTLFSQRGGTMQIIRSGVRFFEECQHELHRMIYPLDRDKVSAALRKEAILNTLRNDSIFVLNYRLNFDDQPVYYRMQGFFADAGDDHHIILGVYNVDVQVAQEEKFANAAHGSLTYSRIAQALSQDYFKIYYVNIEDERYMEYTTNGPGHQLSLQRTGENFFGEQEAFVLENFPAEDRMRVLATLGKEEVLRNLQDEETSSVTGLMTLDGQQIHVALKAQRLEGDESHIVIGVRNIDEQIKREEEYHAAKAEIVTYAQIAQSLAAEYFYIYYVNTETDEYITYSSSEDYGELGVGRSGEDFFTNSNVSIPDIVHPDDQARLLEAVDKENLLRELEKNGTFTIDYRIMIRGEPVYVRLKALRMKKQDDAHILVAISNIDAQVKREAELGAAREAANRDALTGVRSRYAFLQTEKSMNEQIASGEPLEFAVVMCDMNDLKTINDTQGHNAGDQALRETVDMICTFFQNSPVFRFGADEFVVILQGPDYANREVLMEQLLGYSLNKRAQGGLSVAPGIAEFIPMRDTSLADVLNRADNAMYINKHYIKTQK